MADAVFSLILGPHSADLRGIPKVFWTKPLKYYIRNDRSLLNFFGIYNTLDNFGELVELYMHDTEAKRIFTKGLEGLAQGDTLLALAFFEKVRHMENSPVVDSYYAFCIAKERGQVSKAISLCRESIKREPNNSLHYLNLGRIHLLENNKTEAIRIFREGLNFEENQQIVDELKRLEIRKPPVFRFLKRSNPINKYFGIILKKLRLR